MKFAVFGDPISHSRSPEIHQQFAEQAGLTVDYQAIQAPLQAFPERLEVFRMEGGKGANVTLPLKEKAFELCVALTTKAEKAAAVNTLIPSGEGWLGDNTDGDGLVTDLLRLGMPLQEQRVVLLGAGGAARGVIQPLLDMGVRHIFILNRTIEKADALATVFGDQVSSHSLDFVPPETLPEDPLDVIINATSSGIHRQGLAIHSDLFAKHPFCYDMMYGKELTPFQLLAENNACRHANGLGMLVEQAAISFSRWTGYVPDTKPVLHSLRESLNT